MKFMLQDLLEVYFLGTAAPVPPSSWRINICTDTTVKEYGKVSLPPKWGLVMLPIGAPPPLSQAMVTSATPISVTTTSLDQVPPGTPSGPHDPRTFLTASRDTVATNAAGRPQCPAVCHSSSVPVPALSQQTSLTKHNCKIKLRLSRWWEQNMKPNVGHFSAEVSCDYTGHMATKLALSTREKGDSERFMDTGTWVSGLTVNRIQPSKHLFWRGKMERGRR